jgi:phosphoglycerate-specific signal transduction histidine kinase
MADPNLYQELKDALTKFQKFIDDNKSTLTDAIRLLKKVVPQVSDLLTKLIDLMNKLKDAINKIDLSSITGSLPKLSELTSNVTNFLDTIEGLLPQEKDVIAEVRKAAQVVTSLPSLDTLKSDILTALDKLIGDLQSLNS